MQARAFGLFTEDSQDELERRQADINALYDREPGDFELDFSWQSLEGREATLIDFDRWGTKPKLTPLWHQMWGYVSEHGIQVVGLDNARVLFGGNENFPNQVEAFIRLLVQKAIEIDGAIIIAAHPPKGDPTGFAGTGAWLASVRAGMSLRRPSTWDLERDTLRDPRRMLVGIGANYGAGIGTEMLEIRDGVFVPIDDDGRQKKRHKGPLSEGEMTDLRYRLLTGLKKVIMNGGQVPADVEDGKSMPYRARRTSDETINRIPLNELARAQDLMLEAGQIVRVSVGKKVLIRPDDGPYYQGEEPYLPAHPKAKNAAD